MPSRKVKLAILSALSNEGFEKLKQSVKRLMWACGVGQLFARLLARG